MICYIMLIVLYNIYVIHNWLYDVYIIQYWLYDMYVIQYWFCMTYCTTSYKINIVWHICHTVFIVWHICKQILIIWHNYMTYNLYNIKEIDLADRNTYQSIHWKWSYNILGNSSYTVALRHQADNGSYHQLGHTLSREEFPSYCNCNLKI